MFVTLHGAQLVKGSKLFSNNCPTRIFSCSFNKHITAACLTAHVLYLLSSLGVEFNIQHTFANNNLQTWSYWVAPMHYSSATLGPYATRWRNASVGWRIFINSTQCHTRNGSQQLFLCLFATPTSPSNMQEVYPSNGATRVNTVSRLPVCALSHTINLSCPIENNVSSWDGWLARAVPCNCNSWVVHRQKKKKQKRKCPWNDTFDTSVLPIWLGRPGNIATSWII